jgi:hypothetical protein
VLLVGVRSTDEPELSVDMAYPLFLSTIYMIISQNIFGVNNGFFQKNEFRGFTFLSRRLICTISTKGTTP